MRRRAAVHDALPIEDSSDVSDTQLMQAVLHAESAMGLQAPNGDNIVNPPAQCPAPEDSPAPKRARTVSPTLPWTPQVLPSIPLVPGLNCPASEEQSPAAASSNDLLYQRLKDLTDWHKAGLLTGPEFTQAKCELLGIP